MYLPPANVTVHLKFKLILFFFFLHVFEDTNNDYVQNGGEMVMPPTRIGKIKETRSNWWPGRQDNDDANGEMILFVSLFQRRSLLVNLVSFTVLHCCGVVCYDKKISRICSVNHICICHQVRIKFIILVNSFFFNFFFFCLFSVVSAFLLALRAA